jgi:hypothetical protein
MVSALRLCLIRFLSVICRAPNNVSFSSKCCRYVLVVCVLLVTNVIPLFLNLQRFSTGSDFGNCGMWAKQVQAIVRRFVSSRLEQAEPTLASQCCLLCNRFWTSQRQTSPPRIWIKSLQISWRWRWCPFHPMVWYRVRLQCYSPRSPLAFSRRSFQFLQSQVRPEDCSFTCRPAG